MYVINTMLRRLFKNDLIELNYTKSPVMTKYLCVVQLLNSCGR